MVLNEDSYVFKLYSQIEQLKTKLKKYMDEYEEICNEMSPLEYKAFMENISGGNNEM